MKTSVKSLAICLVILTFLNQEVSAQWSTDPSNTDNIYNTNIGKVGIGKIPALLGPPIVGAPGNYPSPFLQIYGSSSISNGVYVPVAQITSSSSARSLGLGMASSGYPSYIDLAYISTEGRLRLNSTELEVIGNTYLNSKVIINGAAPAFAALNTPGNYRLYVAGGILTEKIKVALSTDAVNWSDFVFNEDYKLRPLNEVESYVKANKHLPEIPSSEEVYKDGLDLAQMDAKLLMKIEELTLYMIELKK